MKNQNEIDYYKFGYNECRNIVIGTLREILSNPDPIVVLKQFIEELEDDKEREHWAQIQREQPGITREEYEAQLEEFSKELREIYYSKAGFLKPRLVKNLKIEEDSNGG